MKILFEFYYPFIISDFATAPNRLYWIVNFRCPASRNVYDQQARNCSTRQDRWSWNCRSGSRGIHESLCKLKFERESRTQQNLCLPGPIRAGRQFSVNCPSVCRSARIDSDRHKFRWKDMLFYSLSQYDTYSVGWVLKGLVEKRQFSAYFKEVRVISIRTSWRKF